MNKIIPKIIKATENHNTMQYASPGSDTQVESTTADDAEAAALDATDDNESRKWVRGACILINVYIFFILFFVEYLFLTTTSIVILFIVLHELSIYKYSEVTGYNKDVLGSVVLYLWFVYQSLEWFDVPYPASVLSQIMQVVIVIAYILRPGDSNARLYLYFAIALFICPCNTDMNEIGTDLSILLYVLMWYTHEIRLVVSSDFELSDTTRIMIALPLFRLRGVPMIIYFSTVFVWMSYDLYKHINPAKHQRATTSRGVFRPVLQEDIEEDYGNDNDNDNGNDSSDESELPPHIPLIVTPVPTAPPPPPPPPPPPTTTTTPTLSYRHVKQTIAISPPPSPVAPRFSTTAPVPVQSPTSYILNHYMMQ